MKISSTAFQQDEHIPDQYSQNGENINPPLTFSEIPVEAESLILLVDDPDAPNGLFTHWMLYNMSPATLQILENNVPETAVQGKNDAGHIRYDGPKPPSGTHRYFFRLYAMRSNPGLPEGSSREDLEQTLLQDDIIEIAELVGLYEHKED